MKALLVFALALFVGSPAFADNLGSATGGTAASQSGLSGGLCISSPVSLSSGQQASLLIDCTTHALVVESSGSGGTSPPPYQFTPVVGSQAALAVATSTALTPPATAKFALITVESNATYSAAVNCWTDGTAPTALQGNTIVPFGSYWVASTALSSVKCIQVAASGAIDVSYYK